MRNAFKRLRQFSEQTTGTFICHTASVCDSVTSASEQLPKIFESFLDLQITCGAHKATAHTNMNSLLDSCR